ncbi:AAA family ATPase [Bacillus wiedmannii]|uniref:ATP-binding protein n=1 Tax=Bacillus wiedmannii TaxID=1890302 RepID=UPI00019FD9A1|nr:ATP-binding protein [Bacillus wiedmannii]EEK67683.1 hypothetical protein bcere0006_21860 [Bacillus wiedmannii]MCC2380186.1 AAA family ATPase [Bacillus wiedmannii]MCC2424203.1 AAA family ATPase [Bacillus wiedmannii]
MPTLIYLVGLPASGKSSYAKMLQKQYRAAIVATDELRQTLFYSETKQGKTGILYRYAMERVREHLEDGRNVILDATNIERGFRVKALHRLHDIPNLEKRCYVVDTPYQECQKRNQERKRTVEERILEKMYKKVEFPLMEEGWDQIEILHTPDSYNISKQEFQELLTEYPSYEEFYQRLNSIPFFSDMFQYDQGNPYHSLSLCQHTYMVYAHLTENYEGEDLFVLQTAAVLHDTGKPFCRVFKKLKGYHSYYGHEYVSTHIACHFLMELGFEWAFIEKVLMITEFHMKMLHGGEEAAREIYHYCGDEMLTKLYFFRDADAFAK